MVGATRLRHAPHVSDLASYSIYTMRHSKILQEHAAEHGSHNLQERRAWRTGYRLWRQAVKDDLQIPLIFSGAEAATGLIYWALVVEIEVDDGTTTCRYSDLRPIQPPRPLSALRLLSSGLSISDNYIRPYAICHTPTVIS
jgi:hypothetical protein